MFMCCHNIECLRGKIFDVDGTTPSTHTHTHTHTHTYSLSLSLTHTHTHTATGRPRSGSSRFGAEHSTSKVLQTGDRPSVWWLQSQR